MANSVDPDQTVCICLFVRNFGKHMGLTGFNGGVVIIYSGLDSGIVEFNCTC